MKKLSLILTIAILPVILFSQVIENRSGIKEFNISKKGNDFKSYQEGNRGSSDKTPPAVSLLSPSLKKDSLFLTESKTVTVKGKATDTGGIFEVLVNGVEASLQQDGSFTAEIPVAVGISTVRIQATDVALNRSTVIFRTERSPGQPIAGVSVSEPEKPKPVYSINVSSPADASTVTASDKYNLKACLKSSEPINRVMIFRNGSFVNGYLARQISQSGDCSFSIDETVPLRLGINDFRIEFYVGKDTVKKSVIIEYSFHAANYYALLIGNEKYDDPKINELSDPVKDTRELYNLLIKEYTFDKANVFLLENPTKEKIIGTLHELRSKIKPDDNLLIFYAGHGFWDEGMGVGYWLPRDARKDNPVNWIPNTDLTNYLGAIKSRHTLLIADACFSGAIFKTRAAFSNTFAVEMLYQMNSRKAITSGTLTEVPDKSVFFQYLAKNLKENINEYLPAEELFSKMRVAVINNSENVPQFGTIQNVGDEGGDFIFIKRK